jgi:hypothetical protein
MNKIMKIFKDMLTEKTKYSQGRVYLMWSVFAYYITLAIMTITGIRKSDVDMEKFRMIVDALEYAMTLFGGYVFGGKFIDIIKHIKGPKSDTKEMLND